MNEENEKLDINQPADIPAEETSAPVPEETNAPADEICAPAPEGTNTPAEEICTPMQEEAPQPSYIPKEQPAAAQYYNNMQYGAPYQQPQYQQPQYGFIPPQPVQPAVQKKTVPPLMASQKKLFTLMKIGIILIAAIFAYCIISDVVLYATGNAPSSYASSEVKESSSSGKIRPDNTDPDINYESTPSHNSTEDIEPDKDGRYSVEEVAALVRPSIVEIVSFGEDGSEIGGGSGIILSADGYILTNAHVVSEADRYGLVFHDGSKAEGFLVGYDIKSDIAVLITDDDYELTPAALGDSDALNVGEEVVAIGSPAGFTSTVTSGIVSATGRQIRNGTTGFYMECIQTDAAISPGNSGGALVNMYGQVVGITSSKYASYYSGTYEGLGFAISINQAAPIFEELIENGYISGRVRIGITFMSMEEETVQAEFMASYELDKAPSEGLWITEIAEDCDVAKTQLQPYDLILEVNGKKVNNYDDLFAIIENSKAGDVLVAKCRRYELDNGYEDFTIEFALMEDTSGDY